MIENSKISDFSKLLTYLLRLDANQSVTSANLFELNNEILPDELAVITFIKSYFHYRVFEKFSNLFIRTHSKCHSHF